MQTAPSLGRFRRSVTVRPGVRTRANVVRRSLRVPVPPVGDLDSRSRVVRTQSCAVQQCSVRRVHAPNAVRLFGRFVRRWVQEQVYDLRAPLPGRASAQDSCFFVRLFVRAPPHFAEAPGPARCAAQQNVCAAQHSSVHLVPGARSVRTDRPVAQKSAEEVILGRRAARSLVAGVPFWDYPSRVRVIALSTLKAFWERSSGFSDSREPILAWYRHALTADWASPAAVKADFGQASILKDGRVVFNLAGNKYRLVVWINYAYRIVYVRFVGTHAQYDRIDAQTV